MKKMLFFAAVVLIGFGIKVNAQSITYQGFGCSNPINADDPTPTNIFVESRFEVSENLDDGFFRLSLIGGLPRFVNGNQQVCIDSDTAIGFIGTPEAVNEGGLPLRLDNIDATAYFNGHELIIVVSSLYTDLSQSRGTFSSFNTSRVQPVSNTLFLSMINRVNHLYSKRLFIIKGLCIQVDQQGR